MTATASNGTPAPASPAANPVAVPPVPAPVQPVAPPPEPAPALLAGSVIQLHVVDHAIKGVHLETTVSPDQVIASALEMDQAGLALDTITGVDWLAEKQMEVVYDYFHPVTGLRVAIRSRVSREDPEIPSISQVFPGANWHERETHDFFGIIFAGHPNLEPFLLPEDATYHPLRKDFAS
ncbi:MAG TPA: NADH-quinone oxidoreductase subunit C [Verrucomicrobiae bacterium]|nr:NADH-quinone oxidoreductase subunit C [Verrucomicrobiae bacterium]